MTGIDRLDADILGILAVNARAGIAEIAVELQVTRATVHQRLRRLEDDGVLLGFQPVIDLAAVGLPLQATVSIEIDQRVMPAIVADLAEVPEVLEVRIQTGREDLAADVAIASLEDLQSLTASIVAIKGVRKTTSTFTVSTPVARRVQPLLRKITAGAGRGRATPQREPGRS